MEQENERESLVDAILKERPAWNNGQRFSALSIEELRIKYEIATDIYIVPHALADQLSDKSPVRLPYETSWFQLAKHVFPLMPLGIPFLSIEKKSLDVSSSKDLNICEEKSLTKYLAISMRELRNVQRSIKKKLKEYLPRLIKVVDHVPAGFPTLIKKQQLRLFRIVSNGEDSFEELLSPAREKDLYKHANKFRKLAIHVTYRKKEKNGLLKAWAERLSQSAGIEYGDALEKLTCKKKRCKTCGDFLPDLKEGDGLRKFIPQGFFRERIYCSASCGVIPYNPKKSSLK